MFSIFQLVPYYRGHFHAIHGKNVKLSSSGETATCINSNLHQRFTFSSTPVLRNQMLTVQFSTVRNTRFGFGFTNLNPEKLKNNHLDFHRLKNEHQTWTREVDISINSGNYFYFWYDTESNVYFVMNGKITKHKNRIIPKKKPLWALMYIRGANNSVTLVKHEQVRIRVQQAILQKETNKKIKSCNKCEEGIKNERGSKRIEEKVQKKNVEDADEGQPKTKDEEVSTCACT